MDRRGFVTTGLAAGLAGFTGAGGAVTAGLERSGLFRVGKTLADGTVRLSSNENPLGLSPAARQAVIDNLVNANRYPGDWSRSPGRGPGRARGRRHRQPHHGCRLHRGPADGGPGVPVAPGPHGHRRADLRGRAPVSATLRLQPHLRAPDQGSGARPRPHARGGGKRPIGGVLLQSQQPHGDADPVRGHRRVDRRRSRDDALPLGRSVLRVRRRPRCTGAGSSGSTPSPTSSWCGPSRRSSGWRACAWGTAWPIPTRRSACAASSAPTTRTFRHAPRAWRPWRTRGSWPAA